VQFILHIAFQSATCSTLCRKAIAYAFALSRNETQGVEIMNGRIVVLLAAAAMVVSPGARAQLTSVDNGAAATDGNGLMWANTVGINVGFSYLSVPQAGTAQAWVAGLNSSDYGGYNDWTLATGNASLGINTTTNQLGELFYTDCGNSSGNETAVNNSGKNCKAMSALTSVIATNSLVFSGSAYLGNNYSNPDTTGYFFWVYAPPTSAQVLWTNDTTWGAGPTYQPLVGIGDAVAVREVAAAPEIDPASAAGGLTLLLGGLAVLRGRRNA
jgi:hypothetical protein